MDEVVKSIKAFLYDRTVSPLFGAFISAWIVWNYRLVIVFLDGDASLSEKMRFIDSYFWGEIFSFWGHTYLIPGVIYHDLLGPGLLASVYIFGYPWLAKPVYSFSLKKQKELREIKQAEENARLLSVEESRVIIKENEQLLYKAEEEAQKYRERIASLIETINELEEKLAETKNKDSSASLQERFFNPVKGTILDLGSLDQGGEVVGSAYVSQEPKLKEGDGDRRSNPTNSTVVAAESTNVSPSEIEARLFRIYTNGGYSPMKFQSEDEHQEILNKLAGYASKHGVDIDMFTLLALLVLFGGEIRIMILKETLQEDLNSIEIDHLLKKLKGKNLISENEVNGTVRLSDVGNEMAVESGLTSLDKKLKRQ